MLGINVVKLKMVLIVDVNIAVGVKALVMVGVIGVLLSMRGSGRVF